ncbi:MAG: hypothetical protein AB7F43_12960 [Bacteriovoracia bacterium]
MNKTPIIKMLLAMLAVAHASVALANAPKPSLAETEATLDEVSAILDSATMNADGSVTLRQYGKAALKLTSAVSTIVAGYNTVQAYRHWKKASTRVVEAATQAAAAPDLGAATEAAKSAAQGAAAGVKAAGGTEAAVAGAQAGAATGSMFSKAKDSVANAVTSGARKVKEGVTNAYETAKSCCTGTVDEAIVQDMQVVSSEISNSPEKAAALSRMSSNLGRAAFFTGVMAASVLGYITLEWLDSADDEVEMSQEQYDNLVDTLANARAQLALVKSYQN